AFAIGTRVSHTNLTTAGARWSRFATAATDAGFAAVDALPMRLRSEVIGALNLFRASPGGLSDTALRAAQALVAVATIGLLQERSIRHQEILTEQLQTALNSRVVIEQAKGLVAERLGVDMQTAFATLRSYARGHNLKLSDVAHAVIDCRTGTHDLLSAPTSASRPRR
ncbi:MAG TPA: ANTAR domain-containing protein, partial [Pseudonocardiaceae bacterium]|nr:ANTAR domain-containing protein [Pseudonocardiaceae bacterium]